MESRNERDKKIKYARFYDEFIEKMEEVGDVWTEEQVNDVYGDSSFEDALADRQFSLDHMSDIISKVIDK